MLSFVDFDHFAVIWNVLIASESFIFIFYYNFIIMILLCSCIIMNNLKKSSQFCSSYAWPLNSFIK